MLIAQGQLESHGKVDLSTIDNVFESDSARRVFSFCVREMVTRDGEELKVGELEFQNLIYMVTICFDHLHMTSPADYM